MKVAVVRIPVTLTLQIESPLETLKSIIDFLKEKNVVLESLLLQDNRKNISILVLNVLIEKDRISGNLGLLASIPGILRIDEDDENSFTSRKNLSMALQPYRKNR